MPLVTATHWGVESADQLPGYRRRALTLLETLCDVAASGKHRRLYQQITAEVVNSAQVGLYKLNAVDPALESAWFQPLNLKCDILVSKFAFKCNLYRYTQDLAMLSMLELASKKKIKRKIGHRGAAAADTEADADDFLELARTAAQTLKAVCTLYEWRDQYVAAAAATYPPRGDRDPAGAPGSETLLDAVVNGAFVAVRRATPIPSVGTVQSVVEVGLCTSWNSVDP
jgi:hypothetical protein